ncbi:hypothetical protein F5146DRAFT_1066273 [Armillaria mellea]|nr:hypothetical protein F5146DRAFT_1066273 [Armillaria mellea]
MHLYIALYSTGNVGAYHWALLPTDDALDPEARSNVNLLKTKRLLCCVHLPTIDLAASQFHDFVTEQPAEQGDTPLPPTHQRWTCQLWCIRVLSQLADTGLIESRPSFGDSFFRKICALGMLAERSVKNQLGFVTVEHDSDIST